MHINVRRITSCVTKTFRKAQRQNYFVIRPHSQNTFTSRRQTARRLVKDIPYFKKHHRQTGRRSCANVNSSTANTNETGNLSWNSAGENDFVLLYCEMPKYIILEECRLLCNAIREWKQGFKHPCQEQNCSTKRELAKSKRQQGW